MRISCAPHAQCALIAHLMRTSPRLSKVFIEATELGDVLATSGLEFLQGIEAPYESSAGLVSRCGQASTLTFYAQLFPQPAPQPPQPLPAGNGAGAPWTKLLSDVEFRHTWSWRRAPPGHHVISTQVGEGGRCWHRSPREGGRCWHRSPREGGWCWHSSQCEGGWRGDATPV